MSTWNILLYVFAFIGLAHTLRFWAEWAVAKLEQWADMRDSKRGGER